MRLAFTALLLSLLFGTARASEVVILGDSIGEGVAMAAHVRGLARISVHIRGPQALAQIARAPEGSIAVLVLGTNDAEGPTTDLGPHIDKLVQAAAKKNIRLIWVGPSCVRRRWDAKAEAFDKYLSEALAARNIQYVSTRDPTLCLGHLHDLDGVHFKMQGYTYIWEKARSAAGIPAPEGKVAPTTLVQADNGSADDDPTESKRKKPRKSRKPSDSQDSFFQRFFNN
jgi:hypothetical protein